MKKKIAVFAVALLSACVLVQQSANAIGISIEVGDRPFYEGASYWDDGYEFIWLPGHWDRHHVWVHGRYERRGEFRKEHAHEHHHHHHHDDEHHH